MGIGDKISNAADKAVGKAKETIGDVTNNDQLQAEGRIQQGKADVKEGVEGLKDKAAEAFNDLTDDDKR